jgi:hypothetical protein
VRPLGDTLRAVPASTRLVAGRWAPVLAFLPCSFPLVLYAFARLSPGAEGFDERSVPALLVGVPLSVLAIFLGVRVVAGEIDQGTLEIAYTVPGGAGRVWIPKLLASAGILLAAEAVSAAVVFFLLTGFPPDALYAAYQGAVFHLAVAMGLAAWCRGEITGAMATAPVLVITFLASEWVGSPFWSQVAAQHREPAEILAMTVQNRIGYALAIAAVLALGFARANRREKMLGS